MNPLEGILQQLQQQAGPRGYTFAGRQGRPGESLVDLLGRSPQGEMESGSIAMQSPDLLRLALYGGLLAKLFKPRSPRPRSAPQWEDPSQAALRELYDQGIDPMDLGYTPQRPPPIVDMRGMDPLSVNTPGNMSPAFRDYLSEALHQGQVISANKYMPRTLEELLGEEIMKALTTIGRTTFKVK